MRNLERFSRWTFSLSFYCLLIVGMWWILWEFAYLGDDVTGLAIGFFLVLAKLFQLVAESVNRMRPMWLWLDRHGLFGEDRDSESWAALESKLPWGWAT